MQILEIGGGTAGMQFVLADAGAIVTNVDPGEKAPGVGWALAPDRIHRLNRAFKTDVTLLNTTLPDAGLQSNFYDIVMSISTIEHIPPAEIQKTMEEVGRVLKPGGRCVLTIDLFFNLFPFSRRTQNVFGTNINLADLIGYSHLVLVEGNPNEMYGFEEFDEKAILSELEYVHFGGYPAGAQCLVLSKPR